MLAIKNNTVCFINLDMVLELKINELLLAPHKQVDHEYQ